MTASKEEVLQHWPNQAKRKKWFFAQDPFQEFTLNLNNNNENEKYNNNNNNNKWVIKWSYLAQHVIVQCQWTCQKLINCLSRMILWINCNEGYGIHFIQFVSRKDNAMKTKPMMCPYLIVLMRTNICEKCPSSIRFWDSNPQPSGHEPPPLTTRPGLLRNMWAPVWPNGHIICSIFSHLQEWKWAQTL